MYNVELQHSIPSEFILSLYTYQCKKSHKKVFLGAPWYEKTKQELPISFVEELEQIGMSLEWDTLLLLACLSPNQISADQFLEWIEALTVGAIYEMLAPFTNIFPVDLKSDLAIATNILNRWNEYYFSKVEGVHQLLKDDAQSKSRILRTAISPEMQVESITNGLWFEPLEGLETIRLMPQFHQRPTNYAKAYRGLIICYYPMDTTNSNQEMPSEMLSHMTRSLSVESRLRILRYLRSGPKKFTEVVTHLGLAKGIVHDHLYSLRSSGFVRTHMLHDTPSHYSLREDSVDRLKNTLATYLELYI